MAEKYEPYLIGVRHNKIHSLEVIRHILELGVKSVGVEVSESFFKGRKKIRGRTYERILPSTRDFWREVINTLEKNNVKIIYLVPFSVQTRALNASENLLILFPKVIGKESAIVKDSLTMVMEKNALQKKPDAIIVGGIHALVMQKSLEIPENKFKFIGGNNFVKWVISKYGKEIMRFRSARIKARVRRQARIRKRKSRPK